MTNNMQKQDHAQDVELEQICKAQQDRISAEEQESLDISIKCEAAQLAAFQRRIRNTYHVCERVCMFFSGASASLAVHYFMAESLTGLGVSIIGAFVFYRVSTICGCLSRKKICKS